MTYFAPSKSGCSAYAAIEHQIGDHRFDPHAHAALARGRVPRASASSHEVWTT